MRPVLGFLRSPRRDILEKGGVRGLILISLFITHNNAMMYAAIGTVMAQYNTVQSRIRNAINSKT